MHRRLIEVFLSQHRPEQDVAAAGSNNGGRLMSGCLREPEWFRSFDTV
jgi:hypothetical protein